MPTPSVPDRFLQLRSTIKSTGQLELSLVELPTPTPTEDEVLVRVEAAPLNPSDLALLVGAAQIEQATAGGTAQRPVLTAPVPEKFLKAFTARLDQSMPVGNEGAGTVIAAGTSARAQALLGRRVAMIGGDMYAQLRCLPVDQCLPLPADASAADGASCFVNPLTSLGMVETMKLEGHRALVHTAAASNLGQMLVRICQKDGVGLVNVVRKPEQAELLREHGARYVVDSSDEQFVGQLTDAIAETGATLAFDAIGGGRLASQILGAMEAAINRSGKSYSRYGSSTHKQVYIYGALDISPTEIHRNFGMAWGVGGWLLTPFLQKIGPQRAQALRERVIAELKTTFRSHYTREIGLQEALDPSTLAAYCRRATGEKFLLVPNRD